MSVETSNRSEEKVWARGRMMSVAARLLVILPVAISYQIGDPVGVATAATPNTVDTNAPAPTPVAAVTALSPALIPLPPEISIAPLKDPNGASFKLEDFYGKVTVINLWATWC